MIGILTQHYSSILKGNLKEISAQANQFYKQENIIDDKIDELMSIKDVKLSEVDS